MYLQVSALTALLSFRFVGLQPGSEYSMVVRACTTLSLNNTMLCATNQSQVTFNTLEAGKYFAGLKSTTYNIIVSACTLVGCSPNTNLLSVPTFADGKSFCCPVLICPCILLHFMMLWVETSFSSTMSTPESSMTHRRKSLLPYLLVLRYF